MGYVMRAMEGPLEGRGLTREDQDAHAEQVQGTFDTTERTSSAAVMDIGVTCPRANGST